MIKLTLAAAALVCASGALAQAPAAHPTAAVKTTVTTTKTTPPVATVKATTVAHSRTTKTTSTGGRMVTAKLANGKTVTYNCSLAGNKTKAACK